LFARQYVNTYGTQTTNNAIEQYTGDGKVLARPGDPVSSFGGRTQFSWVMGKTQGGDDQLFFIDEAQRVLVRFGLDGSVPQSMVANYRTELIRLTEFARFCNESSIGNGIHGGWNQNLNEAYFMFRLRAKENYQWTVGLDIKEGDLVIVEGEYCDDFEQTEQLFKAKQSVVSSFANKPGLPGSELFWERLSVDNDEYYVKDGIAVSQYSSGMSYRTPFVNDLMLSVDELIVSVTPRVDSGAVFEHDNGKYLTYYSEDGLELTKEGFVEMVFNYGAGQEKLFQSLQFQCEVAPYKIYCRTKTSQRTIYRDEFHQMVDRFVCPIGTDDTNGSDVDSTALFGEYLIVRFYFAPDEFQRLTTSFCEFTEVDKKLG
jgi:hypothetical protein